MSTLPLFFGLNGKLKPTLVTSAGRFTYLVPRGIPALWALFPYMSPWWWAIDVNISPLGSADFTVLGTEWHRFPV